MTKKYRIIRHYFNGPPYKRVINTGLTLEQAQAHCSDPQTSSRTATRSRAKRIGRGGPWFDGYAEEHGT